MIFCRKHASSRFVQPQFAQQSVEKIYVARVHGHPTWDTFSCDASIADERACMEREWWKNRVSLR